MRFQFIASEIWIGLRRNLSMTVAVIIVAFVSLTFIGSAALLQTQVTKFKDDWYGKVEVSVLLCPTNSAKTQCASGEATEAQIKEIESVLASPEVAPEIEKVSFESKADAWKSFSKRFADQWLLSQVTEADMNASFRIKLVDPQKYQVIADVLTGKPGVEEVQDQRQILEPIFRVLNGATIVAASLAAVMLLAAVLLITTTIRLSALSRRRETGIMRLVGASNFVIRLPFMLEGAFAALIGSVLAVTGLWAAVKYLGQAAQSSSLQWVPVVTAHDVWTIAPYLIVTAVVVAMAASALTLRRFLKV
ncbi:permease-like cell division protein FtsX [Rarobacter incanus]|uniref:Cell division protein FtsX n=1 Tax=Rarobacter incanus TaxID=153494 RepID=A0A542SRQ0_9MICO|nr:permease-like cell division protein FtsX [Rarobacter incanus]TQK77282.1 cell division transport system permease protein [Rarobacter incanus]